MKKIIQDKESVEVLGSNDENKFVIIYLLCLGF